MYLPTLSGCVVVVGSTVSRGRFLDAADGLTNESTSWTILVGWWALCVGKEWTTLEHVSHRESLHERHITTASSPHAVEAQTGGGCVLASTSTLTTPVLTSVERIVLVLVGFRWTVLSFHIPAKAVNCSTVHGKGRLAALACQLIVACIFSKVPMPGTSLQREPVPLIASATKMSSRGVSVEARRRACLLRLRCARSWRLRCLSFSTK